MTTKYDNMRWLRCARTGGVDVVTLSLAGEGQGNDGVSIAVRGCWVQNRKNNSTVKMSIGTPATAVYGVELAMPDVGAQPLWVPISDLAQLYFYGFRGDKIDIIYLLG
jgi:hypothetical protein